MKRSAAHLLRRIARKCIKWPNQIDPPASLDLSGSADTGRRLAERAIRYAGQTAGRAVAAGIEVAAAEERLAKARRDQARGIYVAPKLRPL